MVDRYSHRYISRRAPPRTEDWAVSDHPTNVHVGNFTNEAEKDIVFKFAEEISNGCVREFKRKEGRPYCFVNFHRHGDALYFHDKIGPGEVSRYLRPTGEIASWYTPFARWARVQD